LKANTSPRAVLISQNGFFQAFPNSAMVRNVSGFSSERNMALKMSAFEFYSSKKNSLGMNLFPKTSLVFVIKPKTFTPNPFSPFGKGFPHITET